jgi:hypothetical protein
MCINDAYCLQRKISQAFEQQIAGEVLKKKKLK